MNNGIRCRHVSLALGLVTFGLFHPSLQVSAQPLAVAHIANLTVGYLNDSMTLQFGYRESFFAPFGPALFDQFTLTSSDVGRTFVVTAQNDPDYDEFVQKLTNGQSDMMCLTDGHSGFFQTESVLFSPLPPGSNGIDLQGFAIGDITLTVDSWTASTTSPNFQGTVAIYAAPEPSGLSLLVLGGLVLRRYRVFHGAPASVL